MDYLILIVGFALLIKGADFFVDGAASLAYRLKISTVIVGLTIVALGTSLPEAAVSVSASLQGSNALAISNIIGSNIFNTLVVVGASAVLAPFVIGKEVIRRDLGFNIFCSALLLVIVWTGKISRIEGAVFLLLLAVYIWVLIREARNTPDSSETPEMLSPGRSWLCIIGGAAAIMVGGNLTVSAARAIALFWGMSENLVGLTIVSIGTSLPELVTSVVAAGKGESGLSIGNAIGSSILNILFILGLSSVLHPLYADAFNLYDAAILTAVAAGIWILAKVSPKMTRMKGIVLIACYAAYMAYIILR